jgi:hypothetical protein
MHVSALACTSFSQPEHNHFKWDTHQQSTGWTRLSPSRLTVHRECVRVHTMSMMAEFSLTWDLPVIVHCPGLDPVRSRAWITGRCTLCAAAVTTRRSEREYLFLHRVKDFLQNR